MLKRSGIPAGPLALLLVLLGFVVGVIHLFQLRFSSGDVYPEYSSFRADPLGTRAYFESLQRVGQTSVRRNLQPVQQLPSGAGATLFVFGLPWNELRADHTEFQKLDSFLRNGGRLVVTLYPTFTRPRNFGAVGTTNAPIFKRGGGMSSRDVPLDLGKEWGFALAHIALPRQADYSFPTMTVTSAVPALATSLSWHSALVFTNLHPDWRVHFARDAAPVLMERSIGNGSLVLATDSYFVSNEALQKERAAAVLAWLAGSAQETIFNETHLGVLEQPGIAALARRYNLHGGAAALLCLALLFIWKGAASFIPAASDAGADGSRVLGRESALGFTNLLRRSIAPPDLLQTCLNEWHKSRQLDPRVSPRKLEKIKAMVEAHNREEKPNAVETCRAITQILNER